MIEKACRDVNVWEFIQSLPKGLNTHVGEAGSLISGGQKQVRIFLLKYG
jgi:ATP-binding cassette, subfamily B (MDR/TAP), member 1